MPEPPSLSTAGRTRGTGRCCGTPGDAPWWLSFLRAAVLLSDAGAVDCGLEYQFWCLFFGITLVSGGLSCRRVVGLCRLFSPGNAQIGNRTIHAQYGAGRQAGTVTSLGQQIGCISGASKRRDWVQNGSCLESLTENMDVSACSRFLLAHNLPGGYFVPPHVMRRFGASAAAAPTEGWMRHRRSHSSESSPQGWKETLSNGGSAGKCDDPPPFWWRVDPASKKPLVCADTPLTVSTSPRTTSSFGLHSPLPTETTAASFRH
jgi:hypothetical protein